MDNLELILTEIRDLRSDTNTGFSNLLQRMSVQETKLAATDKTVDELKPKVEHLQHREWKQSGVLLAAAAAFEPLMHFFMGKLGMR